MQRKNDCAGGMMEEWHQKLHNNTSPDDVVICQVRPSCYQYSLTGNILLYYSFEECYVSFAPLWKGLPIFKAVYCWKH